MGLVKALGVGLALALVTLAGAPAVHAQACNSDLTAIFNGIGLNLTSPPAQVQIAIDNDSVFDQFFPAVYFRPNCLSVDSTKPASDDASCALDNGLGGFARPFALDELSVTHDCPGVTDDFDLVLDPEGLRTIEFFPNGVILPPLSSCTISFDLLIDNFPDGFIPPDQGDTTVLQIAGQEGECLNEGEPGTSGNLKSSSVDTGGTSFAQQTCGAAVDKQVSCDGGATWHDVAGVDDADGLQAAGCTGWGGSSPPEVKVRYVATNLSANNNTSGNALENCTLVDSNGLVPGAPPIGTLGDGFDGFIGFGAGGTAALQCSDEFAQMEPNTATLVCECPADSGGPQVQVTVTDQAEIECQEPAIQVVKSCEVDPEFGGPYEYFVSVANPVNPSGASLQNCVISDPGASCDGQSIPGVLAPGESSADVSCISDSDVNTATVTCEIVDAFDEQGQPKTISDEATAECCAVQIDKRISCSGGGPGTYFDKGFDDGVADGCVGWLGDSEMMVAYVARTTKNVSCTITDSNPLVPDPETTFEFGPGGNVILHFSPLLECSEELLEGEPDTATLSCECVDLAETFAEDSDTATIIDCQEPPVLGLDKQCEPGFNSQSGLFEYTLTISNDAVAGAANLVNCVVSDQDASCDGAVVAGPIAPGSNTAVQCDSSEITNEASVTCEIEGAFDGQGNPKTVENESNVAQCDVECREVRVDKQISCDGGVTWVDTGFGDAQPGDDDPTGNGVVGCTGWFDPADPSVGQEIKVRYLVDAPGDGTLENCTLTDSNPAIPAAPLIGDLPPDFNGVVFETPLLECSAVLPGEPDTATLSCDCPLGADPSVSTDTDQATLNGCEEPSLEVSKSCEVDPEFGGPYEYFVTATNPANANGASLQNCVISDPGASCDGQSIPGVLAPGESSADVSCISDSDVNTATVTCEIVGAFDAQGQPKTISNEATAECCAVQIDKRVSCTGGGPGTYLDRGFEDGVIEGCTGWLGDSEIMMAYVARTTKNVSCTLTDSNPLIPDPNTTFEFGPGGNVIIHYSPLLECTEELLEGEPDTATLSCECVDQPEQTASDDDTATINGCEEPALEVVKECTASQDAQGNYTYEVSFENPANANGATLANCVVSDPGASCDGETFAGPFAPGQGDTTTCTSTSSSNTATVTCDIVGSNPRGGPPKTVSSEDTGECIELDKQVSCDGGLTWHDVTGSDDADGFQTEGCTGWFDPSDPSVGQEIKFRYIARPGGDVTDCVLTDSNGVVIGAPIQIGDLVGGSDDVIYETDLLECNEQLLNGEPNTGTLTCTGSSGETVSDDDTATVEGCLEPSLEVSKSCEVDPEFGGPYEYFVTATNPANANGASLQNCVISDPGASCDGQSIPGILAPGESSAEVSCVSDSDVNTATVTCEIVGAFDAQGQPKTISNEATAECCAVQIDKRVSCTGGGPGTYLDRGFEDGVIEGCTGWLGDSEIMMAYVARTTKNVSCTLTDSNPLIPDPDTTFEFGPGGNVIIHFSPLLECTEELLEGEPDTATLSCECVDQPEQTASDDDTATINGCEEPALEVVKECTASQDAQGNYTYEVSFENPANANGATLANCVLSDPGASCDGETFAGPFAPGQGDTTTCTSTSSSNTATVTCDIVGSNPRGGPPKTVSSEDTGECIELDKQVSCDGGLTWHDVTGSDDADGFQTEGCTGWFDPSDPSVGQEIKFRYIARPGGDVTDCVLTDSNGVVIGAPIQIGDLVGGSDDVIYETDLLECNEQLLNGEPNTGTLTCTGSGGETVSDSDTATVEGCLEPALEVAKECTASQDAQGNYTYEVSFENPANANGATLANCVISDPGASCDGETFAGPFAPGQGDTTTCTSTSSSNTATVTCDIVDAFDAQGQPKTVSSEDTAECIELDKQVSCDGGLTWHDVTGSDDADGFQTEGCTGWFDPSDPSVGQEIKFRYIARPGGDVTDCVLTDSNGVVIGAPIQIGDLVGGSDDVIYETDLLECNEQLLNGEPNTGTLTCTGSGGETVSDSDTATVEGCLEPALEVAKECTASQDAQGNYTYEVSFENPANANGATLANCVVSDPGASCDGETFAGPFAPGQGDTTTCTSTSSSNTATVTCDIVDAFDAQGQPKTVTDEDTAECIELDKQVSCDGGLTWHDVTGSDDADGFQTEGCTGWFDPSDPSVGQEIKFRYIARPGGDVTDCVLTDSNGVVIGAPIQIGDLVGGSDDVIYETDLLECNEQLLNGEPNTGTLTCTGSGGETVSDSDTATVEGCLEPALEVAKECTASQDAQGNYTYEVSFENPANANGATLANCVISDPGASCDGETFAGPFAPGQGDTTTCTSTSSSNTATVTCDIVDAFDAQGQPKTVTDEDTAECIELDKQVSCDGGLTWHDVTGSDDADGFQTEGCTGWFDPSDPSVGQEIKFRYIARPGGDVTDCVLTDSNGVVIGAPIQIGDLVGGSDDVIYETDLLECNEQLLNGEPNTGTLTCTGSGGETVSDSDTATVEGCLEPALEVAKECTASQDAQGNYTYEVSFENPANANGATLANCVVSDPGASCDGETFAGPFAPGQGDTTTCTSTSSSNTATVTCDIVDAFDAQGQPKTVTDEDTAECIELDKQVSCDGGLTWHDVTGSDDADGFQTEGCTGWFDPSDPSVGQEIKFRYIARPGGDVTDCVLTDSNGVVIGAPIQIGDLVGGSDDVIYETDLLECNEQLLNGEPNTGTLTCTGSGGETVSDSDTATVEGCLEPALEVAKECTASQDAQGNYTYEVSFENPANANGATLANCVVSDPGASCDGETFAGPFAPGQGDTTTCTSTSSSNTATVTCDIVDAFDAQGQPKTVTDEDTAECIELDKQVSCDGGLTWHDVTGSDDADGFQTEGCTGWFDPSDPSVGQEIKFRYIARPGGDVTDCVLTDSNGVVIGAPIQIGDLVGGSDDVIYETDLLECNEQLLNGEPNTGTLTCTGSGGETVSDSDTATVEGCLEPALEVAKECTASQDAQGNYTYEVSFENPANANGATLANCVVSDPGASCDGEVFAGPFAPGQGDTTTCTSTSSSNTATVTCDIVDAFDAQGQPKTVTSEDTGECIELDKQVSCDGGLTWHDVTGSDDADGFQTEGCTGWFDPSDPSVGQEIKFRYIARPGGDVTDCVLTDSNGVVIGAPIQIGDLVGGSDDVIYETDLLECNEQLLNGEPNTGTLTCTGSGGETVSDSDTATVEGCLEPALEVAKECTASQDAQGNYTYEVSFENPANANGATLANCVVSDPGASCDGETFAGPFAPGQGDTTTCTSTSSSNTATVTCDIVDAFDAQGQPKTVTDEDTAECIELDKQVSCDGGLTWHDVTGSDDADGFQTEGCTGWFDPSDPSVGQEIKFRYIARPGGDVTDCVLTDSNGVVIGAPIQIGDLVGGSDDVIYETDLLECNEQLLNGEPNTGTLTCTGSGGETVSDSDTATVEGCLEPALEVAKECTASQDAQGNYTYEVSFENPANANGATLANCVVSDPGASCDGETFAGPFAPGQGDTTTCTSTSSSNTATVTCDIVDAFDAQGQPKTVTDEDTAECIELDKQVSCDGGLTWHDVTGSDDADGFQTEGCTGWFDPSDPSVGQEIKFRYIARPGGDVTDCVLTDSNGVVIGAPIQIGDLVGGSDDVIYETDLLECNEQLLNGEPNTGTLTCTGSGGETVSDSDTATVEGCLEPALEVAKECTASQDAQGNYTYEVSFENPANANGATLANCVVSDPGASCDGETFAGPFAPGQGDTTTCTSTSSSNTATVTCDIVDAFDAQGQPKTVTDEDTAECIELDKQVSCDGGLTWHDVTGSDDADGFQTEGCTGWFDPSDPSVGQEIKFRYIARPGGDVTDCVLTDSNGVVIGAPIQIGDLVGGSDDVIYETDLLECNEQLLNGEPNTGTLTCTGSGGETVSDSDTATVEGCLEPALEVAKECTASQDAQGNYTYEVSFENPANANGATLANCVVSDPGASCDGETFAGPFAPGQGDTTTCTSTSSSNTATVTCDIVDAFDAQGQPKTVTDEDTAECIELDKQVSCDGGLTWHDVTGSDDADGFQTEGCTGWFDPSDPSVGQEIKFRYIARPGGDVTDCVLTDSNGVVIGAPIQIGDLVGGSDDVIYETDLLECNEQLLNGEPNTGTLTCTGSGGETVSDSDTATVEGCLEPALEVAKECTASQDAQGNYTYEVSFENPANANGATLANCVVSDPGASCDGETFAGPFAPGQGDTTTCTSTSSSNTATVTCDIVDAFDAQGQPKTVTDEDTAECIELDKQVSCDGGLTWHDVTGSDDADGFQTEGCTGWFDPSDPSVGQEIKFRYIARPGGDVTDCVLTDSNGVVIGAPIQIGDLVGGSDDVIYETDLLECNEQLLNGEPNTGTLTCTGSGGETVSDSDTATVEGCLEPALEVTKECTDAQDPDGNFIYTLTVSNPANANGATLANCVISDPEASCDGEIVAGPLAPGASQEVECSSASSSNTATVTCDIVDAFDAQGQPKTVTDEDDDTCEIPDLMVSKECSTAIFDFCPRTPGFWKNHRSEWPVDSLELGGVLYNDTELMAFLDYGGSDGSLKLARHLVATKFNLLSNADPLIQPIVDAADAFLAIHPPGSNPQGADLEEALALKDALDFYNNTDCEFGQHPTTSASEVTITVENTSTNVTLTNCVVTDELAPDCDTTIASLAPGEIETITCIAPDLTTSTLNEVSVTCDIENSSETITETAEDLCEVDVCEVIVDKQVDCGDGFIDIGDVDETCSAPLGSPVTIRWLASAGPNNTIDLVECVLTDSNGVALGDPFMVGSPIDPTTIDLELTRTEKECGELFAGGEPDTARLVCQCAGQPDPMFTVEDRDIGSFTCEVPAVEVDKTCTGSQDAQGNYTYEVSFLNPVNPSGATLENCVISDPGASCDGQVFAGPFAPGQGDTTTCTSPSSSNTATVTCDIVGSGPPGGPANTVSDEDSAQCIELDKQVSCDGGLTWHDVTGSDDADGFQTEGCTGWFDPSDPSVGQEIKFRYIARPGGDVTDCVLTDSNGVVIGAPIQIGDLVGGSDDVIYETDLLECNEELLNGEPNTGTLTCTGSGGETVSDSDTATVEGCLEPGLEVSKTCEPDTASPGGSLWTVTVTNPANANGATLDNCQVDDVEIDGCDGVVGPLAPGESAELSCASSDVLENTVQVTCDIVGAFDAQGQPKTISDEASEAECGQICDIQIDRQVSCDGGTSFVDVGFDDEPVVEACDGNDPGPVKIRWVARNNSTTENLNCFLTDGNPNVNVSDTPVDLPPAGVTDVILMSEIAECSELFVDEEGSPEGVQAVLVCECKDEETNEVFDEDTDVDNAGFHCDEEICPPKLNFEELSAGDIVTEQYAGLGIHVTTDDPVNHPAMIFDSSNPTGEDPDLGTPNVDFGGPGVGVGGGFGQAGQNSVPLGKVLIISEDADSSDPDDNAGGGTIIFTFDEAVELHSVGILDIDGTESMGTVTAFDGGGGVLASADMQPLGDNSYQDVVVEASNVRRIEVWFPSSGSVTSIVFCPEFCVEEAINDPRVQPNEAGHAFYLPGISTEFIFEPSGSFVEFDDGTAKLTGTIRNLLDLDEAFTVDVNFSGRTDIAPAGSPKKELQASAYSENGGPIDTSTWHYYPVWDGTLTGIDAFAGAELLIERTGPSFQVGKGANNKNTNPGGSGWFLWWVLSQPDDTSRYLQLEGQGDINIDILCECIDDVCVPMTWLDDFESGGFEGGTGMWSGPWMENDPEQGGEGPNAGQVQVVLMNGTYWLRLDDQPDTYGEPSAKRTADLSGKLSATLMFNWKAGWEVDKDDEVVVEIADHPDGPYTVLKTFTGFWGSATGDESFDITQWISSSTTVRFRITQNYGGWEEFFFVDNLKIQGECVEPVIADLEVSKTCEPDTALPGGSLWTVTVTNPANANGATLDNCQVDDVEIDGCDGVVGPLAPGESAELSCASSDVLENTVQVTCDIVGSVDPQTGGPKTISDEASEAECGQICDIQIDRQVSCDGGTSFVDVGFDDEPVVEACDGNDPGPVKIRWVARNNSTTENLNCFLTDGNPNVNVSDTPVDLPPAGVTDVILMSEIAECSELFVDEEGSLEGVQAVLVCECKDDETNEVFGGDTDVDNAGFSCQEDICLPKLSFEELSAGDIVTEQYAGLGIHVTTDDPVNHPAMIFDSSNPTGEDPDLGTPNVDFGGPGVGVGGGFGQAGQNSVPLGKVLIISEDADSSDPDDNAGGGTIIFTFDEAVELHSVGILDIDGTESMGTVTAFDGGGGVLASADMQPLGDNSYQDVVVEASNVRRIEVWFPSSGSVTSIVFCPEFCVEEAINDPRVQPNEAGHAFYLPGISTEFIFEPSGSFVEFDDGTAKLTGTIRNLLDLDEAFTVDVNFSGRTDIAPAGSPKKELQASAYSENGGPIDTSTWHYYPVWDGTLTGIDAFAGAELLIERTGPSFQVGKGANNKNTNPGGSGWFLWWVLSQPDDTSRYLQLEGQGDINIDILCECIDDVCVPMTWLDDFESGGFEGGTGMWSGPWMENDPEQGGEGPNAGQVQVVLMNGTYWLRLDDQPDTYGEPSAKRTADLSGKLSATLMFNWKAGWEVDKDDEVVVEIAGHPDGPYTVLKTFTGFWGSATGDESFDITQWISSSTTVRFRITQNYGGWEEFFFVDNLKIQGECVVDCVPMNWSDDLASNTYGGGSGMWLGPWIEDDPTGGSQDPYSGQVQVVGGDLRLDDAPDSGYHPSVRRSVNLSGKETATLKFDWHLGWWVEPDDAVVVEISTDGMNYDVLKTFTGYTEMAEGWEMFDITQWISSSTTIRFRVSNKYGAEEEFFFVDFIEINGECPPDP